MTTADAMETEGLVAAGYTSIQIDDCWLAASRDSSGNLQPNANFPRGIKFVADYVHAKGMQLGLYSDVGSATCCGLPSFDISAVPDAKKDAQLQRDADLLMSWGMDSLKVDGCNADAKTMNVTYPKLGAALAAAAKKVGRPSPWYSCSWPDYVGDVLCGHARTEPCVPLHQIAATCNSARIYSDIADTWQDESGGHHGVKDIMEFWKKNPQLASLRNELPRGTLYFNDPDQLMVGNNGLSRSEAEAQMGMWVMFAAPLILSTELRNGSLSADAKATLTNKEVLALADDVLGLQATQCLDGCSHSGPLYSGDTSVWNKTLADGSVAVAMLNTGNFGGVSNISFSAEAVGLTCGSPTPTPKSSYTHVQNAFEEPVPTNNIRCDAKASLEQLEAWCSVAADCASLTHKAGEGGCLKRCSKEYKWVNGTGNDGYLKAPRCSAPDGPHFKVRNLFKNVDLGTFKGDFWQEVDESTLTLLRLSCADEVVVV